MVRRLARLRIRYRILIVVLLMMVPAGAALVAESGDQPIRASSRLPCSISPSMPGMPCPTAEP